MSETKADNNNDDKQIAVEAARGKGPQFFLLVYRLAVLGVLIVVAASLFGIREELGSGVRIRIGHEVNAMVRVDNQVRVTADEPIEVSIDRPVDVRGNVGVAGPVDVEVKSGHFPLKVWVENP